MSLKTKGAFCSHCQKQTMAQGTKPNHILHLILSILTLGLWLPIWLLITIGKVGGYRCTSCGNRV
jgi:hypothetical protein